MTITRTTAGINKVEDAGKMDAQIMSAEALWRVFPTTVARLSHVSWLGSPAGNREPAGLIVVWQMCYPVQHVLDAAAMASSATFRGILLRAVSGCCYNNGGLRNRRWANAITKHGGKGEWQTSVQSLPSGSADKLNDQPSSPPVRFRKPSTPTIARITLDNVTDFNGLRCASIRSHLAPNVVIVV